MDDDDGTIWFTKQTKFDRNVYLKCGLQTKVGIDPRTQMESLYRHLKNSGGFNETRTHHHRNTGVTLHHATATQFRAVQFAGFTRVPLRPPGFIRGL